MEETNSSLLFTEKNIDDENMEILDDYELLKSIYPDMYKRSKKKSS